MPIWGLLLAIPTAGAVEPRNLRDETWLALDGTAVSVGRDSFQLDYGRGLVTVEVDGWDGYGKAWRISEGDKVTVYGHIDDDAYETAKIEAGSIYVQDLGTYLYASSSDEEGLELGWATDPVVVPGRTTLTGTITSVNPEDETFTIDRGVRAVRVRTWSLAYNPYDAHGGRLEPGDQVRVTGEFEGAFSGRVLQADAVVELKRVERRADPSG